MPKYIVETEDQSAEDWSNWHATIRDPDGGSVLLDRDGDTESEAVCIAVVELLGDLPADFPYPERSR